MSNNTKISVVSPVYNAEMIIAELVRQIETALMKITDSYEIILVEDCGTDNSWNKIIEVCKGNSKVKGIRLSRNFGQHYAITAGLEASSGDHVVVMDCDLQDNPIYIQNLYKKALEGNEIVFTSKQSREHSFFKNLAARFFFSLFNYLSETQSASSSVGSYSMLSRKVVHAFCSIKDSHRHYLMILRNLGFRSAEVSITHDKRFEGKSSYTLSKLLKHAINGITSQSDKLLRLSVTVGFVFFILACLWAVFLIVSYFEKGAFPGYTSLMAMLLFSTGMILISIGVAGIYIGKIFEQTKNRPLYFIDEKINF